MVARTPDHESRREDRLLDLRLRLGIASKCHYPRAAGWIICGWSVCGLFAAGYAGLVCHAINKHSLWIWAALAAFLMLPLAELAIAPSALALGADAISRR